MRITRGTTASAAIGILLLTGCSTASTTEDTPPSPKNISYPEPLSSCVASLETTNDADHANLANVNCGGGEDAVNEKVSGDFQEGARNNYDAADSQIETIVKSGSEIQVTLRYDDGRCVIRYESEGEPVECKHFSDQKEPAENSGA